MNHVVLSNNKCLCRGCGATYDLFPNGKSREIWEVSALTNGFADNHADCVTEDTTEADLVCALCGEAGHQFDGCNTAHGLTKQTWINGYDTGLSAETIWCFMTGRGYGRLGSWGPRIPADLSDFGRCHRLLVLAPDWRARMAEMATVKNWEKMAGEWEALTALYEEEKTREDGAASKLFARLQELSQ